MSDAPVAPGTDGGTARHALVTGCLGGIGRALVQGFAEAGYTVIGMDREETLAEPVEGLGHYVGADLGQFGTDTVYRSAILTRLRGLCGGALHVLINNAAHQVVKPVESITQQDWAATQSVNVTAPFLLTQGLLTELESVAGQVINIASIHGQLTKPEFVAYATSKAALIGMTRALAVELGGRVRVNAICPAAIATPMLLAGFEGRPEAFQELAGMHPAGRVGRPDEVARACLLLANEALPFLTGTCLSLDGGIGARLHDPV